MNVRGERVLIFGDSLSHHGADDDTEIWDVNAGSSRSSSAPGDILASLLLEQGAQAVRIDANVGRSAANFWTAPNRRQTHTAAQLIASDQAFRPTKVVIMLGTNDADAGAMNVAAITKIRDTYANMGAEIWAVGPPVFTSGPMTAAAAGVYNTLAQVFDGNVIDARPLSSTANRAGDGVHFQAAGARPFATALAQQLLATSSGVLPTTKKWLAALLVFGGVVTAGFAWMRWRDRGGLLGDGLGSRSYIDVQPCALLDVACSYRDDDNRAQLRKVRAIARLNDWAVTPELMKEGREPSNKFYVTHVPSGMSAGVKLTERQALKVLDKIRDISAPTGAELLARKEEIFAAFPKSRAMTKYLAKMDKNPTGARIDERKEKIRETGIEGVPENADADWAAAMSIYEQRRKFQDLIRDPDPHSMEVAQDWALEKGIKLSKIGNKLELTPVYPADGPLTRVTWTTDSKLALYGIQKSEIEVWFNSQRIGFYAFEVSGSREYAEKAVASEAWAVAKALKKLSPKTDQETVKRTVTRVMDENNSEPAELYGAKRKRKRKQLASPESDGTYDAGEDAIQTGDYASARRIEEQMRYEYPDEFSLTKFWGDKLPEKQLKMTFAKARKVLYNDFVEQGWRKPVHGFGMKFPWVESPDGKLRLWFKPQGVYFTTPLKQNVKPDWNIHDAKEARAISPNLDIRRFDGERFRAFIDAAQRNGWLRAA